MAALVTAPSSNDSRIGSWIRAENRLRLWATIIIVLIWEVAASSGLLFEDVIPHIALIAVAAAKTFAQPSFYWHLGITLAEIAASLVIGTFAGIVTGLSLGSRKFLSNTYEPYIYYLAAAPKIIFFPIMVMWFGVASGSKIALGSFSCFFPVALNIISGMREIDRTIVRVGKSFRLSSFQMATKIYLPAVAGPLLNGIRLGFSLAFVGVLLAQTKLSKAGLGFLVIQSYNNFEMPQMYAYLLIIFILAAVGNSLVAIAIRRPTR